MHSFWSRRRLLGGAVLAALLLTASAARAQNDRQVRYAVERAQAGVSGKIIQERGGDWSSVTFDRGSTSTWQVSDRLLGVRGEGRHSPPDGPARTFNYEAVVDYRNGRIDRASYQMSGGRPGGGGGWDDRRVPRWLVGTFYGRSPSNGRRVTLTVTRDGEATALFNNGSREQGTYGDGRIRFNNSSDYWDVSRVAEGIRASSGRRSEVFTTDLSGGGDDDTDERVPRWARGTFRGSTPDGEAELVIRADGTAIIRSLVKDVSGRGTYSDGRLRFDWGTYEVERLRDGIRTVNVKDRSNQTEYRRTGN